MREIDGSYGEGGGQLLRTACVLSAITGEAVHLHNIRARRAPPGLAPQHVTAVRSVAALCGAETEGLVMRSSELVFRPGRLRGGDYRFDVGTAGSVTLVLQAVLPAALECSEAVRLRIQGGTDVKAAPPLDYLRFVLLPLLARMGVHIELKVLKRGYYPRGGGAVEIVVTPTRLVPLRLEQSGPLEAIEGRIHISNLPLHIATRMRQTAAENLRDLDGVDVQSEIFGREEAVGPGGAIVLWARMAKTILGGAEVAQRGVAAEQIATSAAAALRREIMAGATLDVHAADQMPVYLARAGGVSCFLTRELTSHARTTLWLLQQFMSLRLTIAPAGHCTRVEIGPA